MNDANKYLPDYDRQFKIAAGKHIEPDFSSQNESATIVTLDKTAKRKENYIKRTELLTGDNIPTPKIIIPGLEYSEGALHMTVAGSNVGKTWLAYSEEVCLTTGAPFFWEKNIEALNTGKFNEKYHKLADRKSMPIIHLDYEAGLDEASYKFDRFLNTLIYKDELLNAKELFLKNLNYYKPNSFPKLSLKDLDYNKEPVFFSELRKVIKNTNAKVIYIDNFAGCLENEDENNSSEMAKICLSLRTFAQEMAVTIDTLHHDNKAQNSGGKAKSRNAQSMRGSSAISAAFTGGRAIDKMGDYYKVTFQKTAYYNPVVNLDFRLLDSGDDHPLSEDYKTKFRGKSFCFSLTSAASLSKKVILRVITEQDVMEILKDSELNIGEMELALKQKKNEWDGFVISDKKGGDNYGEVKRIISELLTKEQVTKEGTKYKLKEAVK